MATAYTGIQSLEISDTSSLLIYVYCAALIPDPLTQSMQSLTGSMQIVGTAGRLHSAPTALLLIKLKRQRRRTDDLTMA